MKRLLAVLACMVALPAFAQTDAFNGFCQQGGVSATTQGSPSTNKLNGVIPKCTVTVYLTGTLTKATIYSDSLNTVLANPFTADALGAAAPGKWLFWAATGQGYDVVMSGGIPPLTFPTPVTLVDLKVGGGGGGGNPCTDISQSLQYNNSGAFGCTPLAYDPTSRDFYMTGTQSGYFWSSGEDGFIFCSDPGAPVAPRCPPSGGGAFSAYSLTEMRLFSETKVLLQATGTGDGSSIGIGVANDGGGIIVDTGGTSSPDDDLVLSSETGRIALINSSNGGDVDLDLTGLMSGDAFTYTLPRANGTFCLTTTCGGGGGTIASTLLMLKGDNAGNAIASTISNPTCVGCAGGIGLTQGTLDPNTTNAVTVTVPAAVTAYRVVLPGNQPSVGTSLTCTAADPALCSWSGASVWVTDPPFNATCDGTTDDHVAIQAALDSGAAIVNLPVSITSFQQCNIGTTGVTVPAVNFGQEFTLNGNGSGLAYSGTGTALTAGSASIVTNIYIDMTGSTGTPHGIDIAGAKLISLATVQNGPANYIAFDFVNLFTHGTIDTSFADGELFATDGGLTITNTLLSIANGSHGFVFDSMSEPVVMIRSFAAGATVDDYEVAAGGSSSTIDIIGGGCDAGATTPVVCLNIIGIAAILNADLGESPGFTGVWVGGTPPAGLIQYNDGTKHNLVNGSQVCTVAGCLAALTTQGTSGEATSTGGVLNVPRYAGYAANLLYGYWAFGDSNTCGQGVFSGTCGSGTNTTVSATATNIGYPNILYGRYAPVNPIGSFLNYGVGGTWCFNINAGMFGTISPTDTGNPVISDMAGTNDFFNNAPPSTGIQTQFRQCEYAMNVRAATSSTNTILVGSGQFSQTGTWTADTTFTPFPGKQSTTNNSCQNIASLFVPNGVFYLFYGITPSSGGTFQVKVDTVLATDSITSSSTLNTQVAAALTPFSSGEFVGVARFSGYTTTSSHAISACVTSSTSGSNDVHIFGVAFPPAVRTGDIFSPRVFAGGVFPYSANGAPYTSSLAIGNAITQAAVAQMDADGLPVTFVDVAKYVDPFMGMLADNGCPASLIPGLHVNTCGNEQLEEAFASAMNLATAPTTGPADIQITVGTGTINANSCGTLQTQSMPVLTTKMTLTFTPITDVSGITGWSPSTTGQLYFTPLPAANTAQWYVCNPTGTNLTPGSSSTWNVSAR